MAAFPHNQNQLQLKLQQQQQQQSEALRNYWFIDGQIPAPMPSLNTAIPNEQSHPPFVHVMGLAPRPIPAVDGGSSVWEAQRKRMMEQNFLENSQLTSLDLLQAGSVSTGLGLSLDDGRVEGLSGNSPLSFLSMMSADVGREMQRMDAEMDRYVRIQGERLRQSILETFQAKQLQAVALAEEKILRRMREKEAELDEINRKNRELEELIKELSTEAGVWQQRAKHNEEMVVALKHNLEQAYAHGNSEVDDNASCCNGGLIDFQLLCREERDIKESTACKACGANEACMLLLPCKHLCLCKECEGKLSFCPRCRSSKFIGMEIYM